ncbi:MAG: Asp-tRNA(Asn)/Glu-tRNA(Gln) amidotransferase subunit GatB [Planctomycetes bacterium]|nr:Asp-tRNA(Asn)/Glu-tRNA(Gln) amidotransferase subunit GatB [Planctomycetota bacterium]
MSYETVIGLEVHVQLKTNTKMFCNCSAAFGAEPNSQICPVCTGQPGVLPVLNKKAVEFACRTALALNCTVNGFTKFDRKNYFYPDLPKAYQISQYDKPFAVKGFLPVADAAGNEKKIGITRVHMEEDAGKLLHPEIRNEENGIRRGDFSFVDLNRSGVPLLEIVSEPDMRSPEEAYQYLTMLKAILQYIDVSDCDMEKGSLRCDANISVRPEGETKLGTKSELKNLNSFKFLAKAIAYEAQRQIGQIEKGEKIKQETLLWDQNKEITVPMRSKEEAHDYRYFPEPDLVPVEPAKEWIESIGKGLPELPHIRRQRFVSQYGLPAHDSAILTQEKSIADYFEETLRHFDSPKAISNWLISDVSRAMNERKAGINGLKLTPDGLAGLAKLFETGQITSKAAKDILQEMLDTGKKPDIIVKEKNLAQISDSSEIEKVIRQVIQDNPKPAEDYRNGKKTAIQSLIGAVMKQTKGRSNPKIVTELLAKLLDELKP